MVDEKHVHNAFMTLVETCRHSGGCCNICRPGSWMRLGEGMPRCRASDVTAQERGGDERKLQ